MDEKTKKAYLKMLALKRKEALAAGATTLKLFSQAIGPVEEALTTKDSGGGICRALAVQWLQAQKKGKDYFKDLLGPGGVVVTAVLDGVIEQFNAMGVLNVLKQRTYTEKELKAAKLKVLEKTESQGYMDDLGGKTPAEWFCADLDGEFRFIGIRGFVDHAMAISLKKKKEAFFDPNLGEMQFYGKPEKMIAFLHGSMFVPKKKPKKDLGLYLNGSRSFSTIERIRCS